jgi:DNA-binding LytR/AlgR family response regulator
VEVLIVADEPLLAPSLEATLDPGGHGVLGPAATAAAALALAEADWPGLAFVHLGLRDGGHLARALRERLGVRSFLVGAAADHAHAGEAATWGLGSVLCGSSMVLRAARIAEALGQGRRPRDRLPEQVEFFHRPERSKPSDMVAAKCTLGGGAERPSRRTTRAFIY